MSKHLSILVECPTPVGPMPISATHCFTNSFEEQVVLRTLPFLSNCIDQNRPISLVLSSASVEALARLDWMIILNDAEKKCATRSLEVLKRLAVTRAFLKQFNGSIIGLFKSAVEQGCLRLIARPFEGVDLSCWISHPGVLNFHFQAIQSVYEGYFGSKLTEISLIGSGYAPHLDAALNDAGFTMVYVDSEAVSGAQSKLTFGIHRPILNPANGIAVCAVDTHVLLALRQSTSISRSQWLNTGRGAVLRDEESGLSSECYPNEAGLVSLYDAQSAVSALDVGLNTATASLKRRLSGTTFKQQHTLTTLWSPTHESLWWEEIGLVASMRRVADANQWVLTHAMTYLKENPEHETAWLGSVLSAARDETEYVWLPRRVVALFERFRIASSAQEDQSQLQRFETVARLLLFSKVSMSTYYAASTLDFLRNQTPAMMLDAAQHLLDEEVCATTEGQSKDSDHPIINWAGDVSLVSATRA